MALRCLLQPSDKFDTEFEHPLEPQQMLSTAALLIEGYTLITLF